MVTGNRIEEEKSQTPFYDTVFRKSQLELSKCPNQRKAELRAGFEPGLLGH